jgi:hypothetical protein
MKQILSIFILFFLSFSQSFANVGVAHVNVNGIVKPSKNTLISRYIEVEKELLTFNLKQGNIIQE